MSWVWEDFLLDILATAGAGWLAWWLGFGELGIAIAMMIAVWLSSRRHDRAMAEEREKFRRNLKDLFGG